MYPLFELGVNYEELKGGKYRFRLLRPMTIRVTELAAYEHQLSLRDGKSKEWASIEYDSITIAAGYAWNGASPKWWVPCLGWVGTPDPVATRLATLFHDVIYQFVTVDNFPLTFREADSIFFRIMAANKFPFANTYHGAVKDFGERYASSPPTNGEHSVMLS